MKILSWDVGIINLSYCIIETNDDHHKHQIIHWGIINLIENDAMKKNRNLVFENIPKKLHEHPFLLEVDKVVIENQPSLKNPQMKSIQMIVYSYFLMYGKVLSNSEHPIQTIDFCNASNKLKVYKGPKISLDSLKKSKKNPDENSMENYIEKNNELEKNSEEVQIKKKEKAQKLTYTQKKKMAVIHVKYFLNEIKDEKNMTFFLEHKKKDDLADSYLQALYSINK